MHTSWANRLFCTTSVHCSYFPEQPATPKPLIIRLLLNRTDFDVVHIKNCSIIRTMCSAPSKVDSMIYRNFLRFFLALSILGAGCTQTPDEQLIGNAIDEIISAVETRKTGAVMEFLADNFSGPDNMDKQQARHYMTVTFLRYHNFRMLKTSPLEIQFQNQDAIASFSISVANGPGLIPDQMQLYRVTTGWRKLNGDWKLLQAKWTTN